MKIIEGTLETERGTMTWLEAGAGWPVILLHAFPLSSAMWRPQLARVPTGWRFIAPDLRGFGGSVPRALAHGRETTIDDYAVDVGALLDALAIPEAVIGGLSMGGYVVFAMHRLAPERFTGVVLADTRPQADTPQGREGRVRLRETLATDGPAGVADAMLPKLLGAATRLAGGEVVQQTRALIEASSAAAIDAAIGALMSRPDSTPGLATMSYAALVMVGEEDEITPPADAAAMQQALARAALCVIPGAGHLSNLEQPEIFSRGLSDFLLAGL